MGPFLGLDITNNGILLTTDYQGRASGEAFVQFASEEHTERAIAKNKQSMGHRLVGYPRAVGPLLFYVDFEEEGRKTLKPGKLTKLWGCRCILTAPSFGRAAIVPYIAGAKTFSIMTQH